MSGNAQKAQAGNSSCPRCRRYKQEWSELCWRCYVEDLEKAAEERGYARGLKDGREHGRERRNRQPEALDAPRIRQLLQLCHPDRHGGSVAANEATRWLLEQRKRLEVAR